MRKFIFVLVLLVVVLTSCMNQNLLSNSVKSFESSVSVSDFDDLEALEEKAVKLVFGEDTYYYGYTQVSSNNQNPFLVKYQGDNKLWVKNDYLTSGDDSRTIGLYIDSNHMYGVFTVTGTQGSQDEDFRRFANEGWLDSYGQGGGAKISVIAKIDPETGEVIYATFLKARLNNGNTNTLIVKDLDVENDRLIVNADSWYHPLDENKNTIDVSGSSPFDYSIEFSLDLKNAYNAKVE